MLMNGKEVNNIIIDGERFTRTYDNLLGKKIWIPVNTTVFNSIGSIYMFLESENSYKKWNNVVFSYEVSGAENKGGKYGQTATVIDWQMKIGYKPEIATTSNSVSFWGLWLCVDKVDVGATQQTEMWVNSKYITILDSGGGVNSPSYLLIIYNIGEVAPLCY